MKPLWVRVGQAVTLPCNATVSGDERNFSLEWRQDSRLIFSAYGDDDGHAAPSFQGRLARDSRLGLTIHAVQKEDEADYQCTVAHFEGGKTTRTERGQVMRVVVHSYPQIVSPANGTEIFRAVGESLTVECKADGVPVPEMSWIRADRIVSANATLHLHALRREQQGEYVCLAANAEGRATSAITLHFSREAIIDFAPTNKTLLEGASVYWHCHAAAHPREVSYRWFYEDKPIKATTVGLRATVNEGELSIHGVRKSDKGRYRCEASNGFGAPAKATAYLDVQYIPEVRPNSRQMYTVGVGMDKSLECDMDANPPVTLVNWSKNGHALENKDLMLEITNASADDQGVYSCQAFNGIGKSAVHEMHVVVTEPPVFETKPPPKIFTRAGESFSVRCVGFGDPMPVQYWIRNKQRINSERLNIDVVGAEDHGDYECIISNPVATVSTMMRIYVQDTVPQPANIIRIDCVGDTALAVEWQPGYDSGHPQTFAVEWQDASNSKKDWQSLPSSSNAALVDGLRPFGVYRLRVASKNTKGVTRSNTIVKHVCTEMTAPASVGVSGNALEWESVNGATSYRIEGRPASSNSHQENFRQMAEVFSNRYVLGQGGPLRSVGEDVDVRVRGLRPPFPPGPPSETLRLRFDRSNTSHTALYLSALAGIIFFFAFLFVIFAIRKNGKIRRKLFSRHNGEHRVCKEFKTSPSLDAAEYFGTNFERGDGSVRIAGEQWARDNSLSAAPEEFDAFEAESFSVVDDMFKHKYIYGKEDLRTHIMDELRIERLRKEFKQSQL